MTIFLFSNILATAVHKFQASFAVNVVSHKFAHNICLCGCDLFSSSAQQSENQCQVFSQLLDSQKAVGLFSCYKVENDEGRKKRMQM